MARIRIYVRHYCVMCGGRTFPFDKYERRTEASSTVDRKRKVLLYSANSNPKKRIAWCFSCNRFTPCKRLSEEEILILYLNRRGVTWRPQK
jgi:hypothetical protein